MWESSGSAGEGGLYWLRSLPSFAEITPRASRWSKKSLKLASRAVRFPVQMGQSPALCRRRADPVTQFQFLMRGSSMRRWGFTIVVCLAVLIAVGLIALPASAANITLPLSVNGQAASTDMTNYFINSPADPIYTDYTPDAPPGSLQE